MSQDSYHPDNVFDISIIKIYIFKNNNRYNAFVNINQKRIYICRTISISRLSWVMKPAHKKPYAQDLNWCKSLLQRPAPKDIPLWGL
jgi:hypothetical protein